MNTIVVVDKNWGIGKNNDLLFRLKKDMKFFRETTTGKVVVMGANTFLSFPSGALPNRVNIVLDSSGAKILTIYPPQRNTALEPGAQRPIPAKGSPCLLKISLMRGAKASGS